MIRTRNALVSNIPNAIKGMRNPLESWDKSDSYWLIPGDNGILRKYDLNKNYNNMNQFNSYQHAFVIGEKDLELALKLIASGPSHRKFMRQIFFSIDITAPMFWWKDFDTYKVGTCANSTSTMHKLCSNPITVQNFSIDEITFTGNSGNGRINFLPRSNKKTLEIIGKYFINYKSINKIAEEEETTSENIENIIFGQKKYSYAILYEFFCRYVDCLEYLRKAYVDTNDKKYWRALIEMLPSSFNYTRTFTGSYENLITICRDRKGHKLKEFDILISSFRDNFQYSELFMKECVR